MFQRQSSSAPGGRFDNWVLDSGETDHWILFITATLSAYCKLAYISGILVNTET